MSKKSLSSSIGIALKTGDLVSWPNEDFKQFILVLNDTVARKTYTYEESPFYLDEKNFVRILDGTYVFGLRSYSVLPNSVITRNGKQYKASELLVVVYAKSNK